MPPKRERESKMQPSESAPRLFATLGIEIAGLGFIVYSPFAVAHIAEGENYLRAHFWQPGAVATHVNACTLTAFCTGSPGHYHLTFVHGSASAEDESGASLKLRIGLEVRDGVFCVRDLYDLLDWSAECPAKQRIPLRDGFYRLTVLSDPPANSFLGDNQHIAIYFEETKEKPHIHHDGVPNLTPASAS
jgi:hypothetical protein